ncbi:MAG: hypothetical protein Q8R25_03060 [bacterium]|nr:hypothetical protein [bacterium]
MNTIPIISNTIPRKICVVLLLTLMIVPTMIMPFVTSAQTATQGDAGGIVTSDQVDPNAARAKPVNCNGWGWSSLTTVSCWTGPIAAWISAILISIAVWILAVAGILFNTLIDHTIINFGQFLYGDAVKSAVETAWTAFRDLANIMIIGIFVFVAISIILGISEFGQKKMIARILIIAVLINFSLLFTKVIIDFSNFTALQFYNAAQLQAGNDPNASSGVNPLSGFAQKGISGAFIDYIGVSTFGNTKEAVKKIAAANDSGRIALLHGVMSAVFLLGAAMVLLYGSFLLASRGILLIFLILTSALAFASYLIPDKLANKTYGWSMWWSSLLRAAIFAPLLMILLWITLAVSKGLKAQSGSLGDLLNNPTKGADYNALFAYIIVLGLLFVSFKVASSFSTTIGGFNWASVVLALAGGAGARVLGFAGRQTFGRIGENVGATLQERSKATSSRAGRYLYDFMAKPFKAAAKQDFNAMRTPLGGAMAQTAKGTFGKDVLTGPKIGGYEGTLKKLADRSNEFDKRTGRGGKNDQVQKAAEAAAAAKQAITSDQQKKMREDAAAEGAAAGAAAAPKSALSEEAIKEALKSRPQEAKEYEEAEKTVELSAENIAQLAKANKTESDKLTNTIKGFNNQREALKMTISDDISKKKIDDLDKQIIATHSQRAENLKEGNARIKEATTKSNEAIKIQARIRDKITESLNVTARATEQTAQAEKKIAATATTTAASRKGYTPLLGMLTGWSEKEKERFEELKAKRKNEKRREDAADRRARADAKHQKPAAAPEPPPTQRGDADAGHA